MTNHNLLALQYALGLLNEQEKQAIEQTQEFKQTLKQWQLHLTKLNTHAPLSKESAEKIWQNISAELSQSAQPVVEPEKVGIIAACLSAWRYLLSGFAGLGLLFSIILFNQAAHAQAGWDIDTDLSKQQVLVTVVTHKHIDKKNACTLWVKKGDKVLRIGLMPETGKKNL
ncbi:hypothetical protein [Candidatus Thioglobus sp.]|uniref:hypothetical protein n=1 Tax=Candidatus Thioglobus sp. TaxID=2026721 RepID=UPI003D13EB49